MPSILLVLENWTLLHAARQMNTYTLFKLDGSSVKIQAESWEQEQYCVVFYTKRQEVSRCPYREVSVVFETNSAGVERLIRGLP